MHARAIAAASSARKRAVGGFVEVSKRLRSVASRLHGCKRARADLTNAVELVSRRLEDYLDLIEVAQQLAGERRHRFVVAGRGGMFERAAYLGYGVESVAAPFAFDAMRDTADFRVVAT